MWESVNFQPIKLFVDRIRNRMHVQRQQQQQRATMRTTSRTGQKTSLLAQLKTAAAHLSQKNAVVSICLEKSTIKLKKMQACQEALQTFSTKLSVQESNFSSFTAALDANMNRSSSKLQEFNVIDAVQSKRSVDNQKFVNKGKRSDTYCCVQLW